jgi:hypothetical protein
MNLAERRGRVVTLLLNIWEIALSNRGPETGYPARDFSWFFSVSLDKYRNSILN